MYRLEKAKKANTFRSFFCSFFCSSVFRLPSRFFYGRSPRKKNNSNFSTKFLRFYSSLLENFQVATPVIALLLTSLKKSHCFSERNTPPCTNCVCNNWGYFGRFSYRQTILVLLLFLKVTYLHFWRDSKRCIRSSRFYSLRESKGALIDTLHMSSCALGRPQTPYPLRS